jgi:hypothetical protein
MEHEALVSTIRGGSMSLAAEVNADSKKRGYK